MHVELEPGGLEEALSRRRWSPGQVRKQVAARRTRYQSLGVGPGDRVFLHFGNDLEFFGDLLAVWGLGACAVPVDGRLTAFEVEKLAAAARPRLALFHGEIEPERHRALSGQGVSVAQTAAERDACQLAEHQGAGGTALDGDALILFTSGTTGDPKGVVHTHRSLRARWMSLAHHLGVARFRRTLCLLPTHFGHGLICNALFPWLAGQDLWIAPPFKPELVMQLGRLIDERQITFLSSVPALWRLALRTARPPERGSLERVHCGSAPLTAHLWSQIREWSGTRDVCNAYGITETGSWVAGLSRADAVQPEDGLIGEPWGAVLKILKKSAIDADASADLLCSPGESGYVWLNTPALMKGYWDREDLTRAVVADGWFWTGDIGSVDDRGRLFLRGREREEINKGGTKIYPSDIDAVVERFPATRDVCTFALEDRLYGQNVGLAVVLGEDDEETLRALHAWLGRHLAEHQMPVRWYVLDEIPRTSRGKINRDTVATACAERAPVDLHQLLGAAS